MRLRVGLLQVAALLIVFVSHAAEASPIIFTDRALFQSYTATLGLPPLALETFDAPVWVNNFSADVCTMHVSGLAISHDCHDGAVDVFGTEDVARFPSNVFSVVGNFSLPQSALGFDYVAGGAAQFQVMGVLFFLSGSGFLGVVDTAQPTTAMGVFQPIRSSGGLVMDDLLLRVPEPATLLLFGSGIVLLQAARSLMKRRRVARRTF
jgi:PEP-CTERM motif